jgi:hypothetical protein
LSCSCPVDTAVVYVAGCLSTSITEAALRHAEVGGGKGRLHVCAAACCCGCKERWLRCGVMRWVRAREAALLRIFLRRWVQAKGAALQPAAIGAGEGGFAAACCDGLQLIACCLSWCCRGLRISLYRHHLHIPGSLRWGCRQRRLHCCDAACCCGGAGGGGCALRCCSECRRRRLRCAACCGWCWRRRLRCGMLRWVGAKEAARLRCCLLLWVQREVAELWRDAVGAGEGGCATAHLFAAVGASKRGLRCCMLQ